MTASPRTCDVAVIGAGINGAGIARDAALRGLSVVLFDKGDVCNGTSWASSRLIHGGLRYLEYGEIPLVFESLHERRHLRRIAGHLVKPLRICIPIYRGAKRGPFLIKLGLLGYDLLSWRKPLPHHKMLSEDEIRAREPGLLQESLRAAACYYDAQVTYAERLVLENVLAARAAGAEVMTYSEVTSIGVRGGTVVSLTCEDAVTGHQAQFAPKTVVNAAGPWVDSVLGRTGQRMPELIGGTKGSHIVVSPFEGAPRDAFYVEAETDGRPFFILPWNGLFLIGTTDIRYDDDPSQVHASRQEVDYLLEETNRVFPAARLSVGDVHYAYAGVRPLPQRTHGPESAITRRHIIKSHRRTAQGLFSIVGGKLTTYRNLAEQTVDKIGKALGRRLPECRTRDTLLPGAGGVEDAREALAEYPGLSEQGIERLLRIYGGRATGIAAVAERRPELAGCIDEGATIPAAEVAFVIGEELPRTLTDIVYRRMMIGLDADQGRPHYARIAELAAAEFGWDAARLNNELRTLQATADALRNWGRT
ncbi:MAG TPA: glycerol-3-phosphate dehydrogenase [Woeseiaceae bacterium]|nr:glycerol-3-phosphate dehydrogenase [Woeseiaceae bacterium]